MKSFRILARHVGIFKAEDGSFYAMESGCQHQQADLTLGHIKGDVVTCYRHGWRYNLRTGECLEGDAKPLRRYGLRVEGEFLYITRGPLSEEQEYE